MQILTLITILIPAGIKFTEAPVTERGIDELSGSPSFVDYNSDGIIDFWAGYAYLNDGEGNFAKQPASKWGGGRVVCFADYDNDGYPDILTTRRISVDTLHDTCYILLYRNLGPPDWGVEDVSLQAGLTDTILNRDLVDVAWLDYDADGWLDFYVSSYEFPMSVGHEDYLYHNNGDGTFTDVSSQAGILGNEVCSRGISVGDFNDDNRIDIFVSVYRLQRNLLFANKGDGTFDEVAMEKGVIGEGGLFYRGHNIGACWGDYDNDGHLDLFTPITHHPGYPGDSTNHLWQNDGPPDYTFTEYIWDSGIYSAEIGSAPSWADYDNDGDLDLYWVNLYGSPGAQGWLYRNEGDSRFTDVTSLTGLKNWQRKNYALWADINSDGFLDAYIPYEGSNSFFISDAGNDNHWLLIKVIGKASDTGFTEPATNASAIGTRITAWAGDLCVMRELAPSGGNGYGSPFNHFLHFGLGYHNLVDSLVVRFPTGEVRTYEYVDADQMLVINEHQIITYEVGIPVIQNPLLSQYADIWVVPIEGDLTNPEVNVTMDGEEVAVVMEGVEGSEALRGGYKFTSIGTATVSVSTEDFDTSRSFSVDKIGPEGGTISSPDGLLTCRIDKGVLPSSIYLTVIPEDPASSSFIDPVPNGEPVGYAYRIGPSEAVFGEPVELQFNCPEQYSSNPSLMRFCNGKWEEVKYCTVEDGNCISARVTDFGVFQLISAKGQGNTPTHEVKLESVPVHKNTLEMSLPYESHCTITVFNTAGRKIKTIAKGAFSAGQHLVTWDGTDAGGQNTAQGVYFVRLETEAGSVTTKLVHLR